MFNPTSIYLRANLSFFVFVFFFLSVRVCYVKRFWNLTETVEEEIKFYPIFSAANTDLTEVRWNRVHYSPFEVLVSGGFPNDRVHLQSEMEFSVCSMRN